jgi:hypothetical protein
MSTAPSIGSFSLATPSAQEALLIANTPVFLLNRLRKDVAVQTVLDNMSSEEIVAALHNALARVPSSPVELVPAYVYLTALSSVDPQDEGLLREISSLDLSRLEWGDAIRSMILAEAVPTITLEIPACGKPCE